MTTPMRAEIRHALLGGLLVVALAGGTPAAQVGSEAPPPFDASEVEATAWRSGQEGAALVLGAARVVEFETNEGTWMSVDVSPDGRTVVFDLLGDLYTVPIEGGEATPLTRGMGWDTQPRFSPDGRRVAFISDRDGTDNVWVMGADGSEPFAVTRSREEMYGSPNWSPDGQYLIARRWGAYPREWAMREIELWMFHVDGGRGVRVTEGEGVTTIAASPSFSPDGRYVYFSSAAQRFSYNAEPDRFQVRRLNRESGEIETLTSLYGGGLAPRLTPDGKHLIYATRYDARTALRIRDLQTREERWLADPITRDNQEGFAIEDVLPGYAVTPDGEWVVLTIDGKLRLVRIGEGQPTARAISFTAPVRQQLAPLVSFPQRIEDGEMRVRQLRWMRRSPDGGRVVFSAVGHLYVAELSGGAGGGTAAGAPRRLTDAEHHEYMPAWSPDGESIVYVSWSDAAGGHLWKIPASGGEAVQLSAAPAFYANPAFSPDGDRIAFVMGTAAGWLTRESTDIRELRWVAADGGASELVLTVSGAAVAPAFSADGERLYYLEGGRAEPEEAFPTSELVSIRLDGLDKKRHAAIRGVGVEAVASPAGDHVLFTHQGNVYLAPMPRVAGEPVVVDPTGGGLPVWQVTEEGGENIAWLDDGRTIGWSLADTFYSVAVEEVLSRPPVGSERRQSSGSSEAAAVGGVSYDGAAGNPVTARPRARGRSQPVGAARTLGAASQEAADVGEVPPLPVDARELELHVPRWAPEGTVALRGARLLTLVDDQVIEPATVVIRGSRIAEVGPTNRVEIPSEATVIDVSGKTIVPGFVDAHAHMSGNPDVFPDSVWPYAANLAYGVTSARDPSNSSSQVFAYAEMVAAGEILGPRITSTGTAITTRAATIDSYEDALALARRYRRQGATFLKEYLQPRRLQRQWFAKAAREVGINLTAEGGGELKQDLSMVLDGYSGFEHSLPVVPIYRDVVELVARGGTAYTPTLVVSFGGPDGQRYYRQRYDIHADEKLRRFTPHQLVDREARRRNLLLEDEYHFQEIAKGAADIFRAGGTIMVGAHGEQQGLGYHWELWAMAEGGLTPQEALTVATKMGAAGIGFGADLGTIEAGKLADLVVLNRNPLGDLATTIDIHYVVMNGAIFDGATLDMLWPYQRPFPPFFWQDDRPKR